MLSQIGDRLRIIRDVLFNSSTTELANFFGEKEGNMKMYLYSDKKMISLEMLRKMYVHGINLNYLVEADELMYNTNIEEGRLLYYEYGDDKYVDIYKVVRRHYFILEKYKSLDNFCKQHKYNKKLLKKYLGLQTKCPEDLDNIFLLTGEEKMDITFHDSANLTYENANTLEDVLRIIVSESVAKVQEKAIDEVITSDEVISAFSRVILKGIKQFNQ